MAEFIANKMSQAQLQAEKAAESGIPNAVPIMVMESSEQAAESATKRRTDMLLTLLSIIVALLAFERLQHFIVAPFRWLKSRFVKPTTTAESKTAEQTGPADPAAQKQHD